MSGPVERQLLIVAFAATLASAVALATHRELLLVDNATESGAMLLEAMVLMLFEAMVPMRTLPDHCSQ